MDLGIIKELQLICFVSNWPVVDACFKIMSLFVFEDNELNSWLQCSGNEQQLGINEL